MRFCVFALDRRLPVTEDPSCLGHASALLQISSMVYNPSFMYATIIVVGFCSVKRYCIQKLEIMYVTLADDRSRPSSILFEVFIFFCTRQSPSYTFNPGGRRVPARPKRRPVLNEPDERNAQPLRFQDDP